MAVHEADAGGGRAMHGELAQLTHDARPAGRAPGATGRRAAMLSVRTLENSRNRAIFELSEGRVGRLTTLSASF